MSTKLMEITQDDLSNNPALQDLIVKMLEDHGVDPKFVSINDPSWFWQDDQGRLRYNFPAVTKGEDHEAVACYNCLSIVTNRESVIL